MLARRDSLFFSPDVEEEFSLWEWVFAFFALRLDSSLYSPSRMAGGAILSKYGDSLRRDSVATGECYDLSF